MLTAIHYIWQRILNELKSAWWCCFVPFDRPCLDAWLVCVCTLWELCVIVCLSCCWAWLFVSWGNEDFDCAYSCAHHNRVTEHHMCLFVLHMLFQVQEISLSSSRRLIFLRTLWTLLEELVLDVSQPTARKHMDDIHCNVTPIMHAGAADLLFCSALAAWFSFAVGSLGACLNVWIT